MRPRHVQKTAALRFSTTVDGALWDLFEVNQHNQRICRLTSLLQDGSVNGIVENRK